MRKILLTSAAIGAIALAGPAIAAAPDGDAPASDPAEFAGELNTVATLGHDGFVIGQIEDEDDDDDDDDEYGVSQIEDDDDDDDDEDDEFDLSQVDDDEDDDDDDDWGE